MQTETLIECRQSMWGKVAFPALMGVFGFVIFTGILPVHPVVWVFWAFLAPYSLVYSPDFTVHDDGVIVHFLWRDAHLAWSDIRRVRKTSINARIYARHLTVFNIVFSFGDPFIVATEPGRQNYKEAFAFIQENIGERFKELRY